MVSTVGVNLLLFCLSYYFLCYFPSETVFDLLYTMLRQSYSLLNVFLSEIVPNMMYLYVRYSPTYVLCHVAIINLKIIWFLLFKLVFHFKLC